jgi:ATP-dependent RNA helicase DDX60
MIKPLPKIHGHYTLNAFTIVRALNVFQGTEKKYEEFIKERFKKLLLPSFGENVNVKLMEKQTQFHFRFIIEFLFRNKIINEKGETVGLSELVSHLNFEEPVNFLLVKLLESDEMKELCLQFSHNKEEVSKKIMSLLIHLFKRVKVYKEQRAIDLTIIADSMDKGFEKIILDYNEKVMQSFIEYFTIYADNELLNDLDSMTLPMSKICFFKKDSTLQMDSSLLNPVKIRSPFIAMSGSGDSFSSVEDVFENIRSDIYFEKSMIPIMNADSNISGYALSFYTSGKANILVEKYQLQGKRIYDMLKDWVLFLKVIVRTLENVSKNQRKKKLKFKRKKKITDGKICVKMKK